ncbi:MAG: hypothetical protein AB7N71_10890, partial [Phycisphaerae bacterium]
KALDQKITQIDLQYADTMAEISSQAGIPLPRDTVATALLLAEAKKMGIRIGVDQVKQALISRWQGEVAANVEALMQRYNASENSIYQFIGDGMSVAQMITIQSFAAGESFARAKMTYRDQNESAVFSQSTIDVEALLEDVADPTDEEARAFFESRKDIDVATLTNTDELTFGYRLPDRVKVEYITIDPSLIKIDRIRTSDVRTYFEENKQLYTKDGILDPTAGPDTKPPKVPMEFEEAETQVRADYRVYKAIQEASRIMDILRAEAFEPWLGQPLSKDGFLTAPAKPVTLRELYEKYKDEYPLNYNLTALSNKQELQETFSPRVPTMSGAGGRRLTLPDYAFRVSGLFVPEEEDHQSVLAPNEPSQVLMTQNYVIQRSLPYQPYLFAVLETDPAGPADNFETQKEQVKRDLKLQRAYDLAREQAEKLAARAKEVGLQQAYDEADALRQLVAPANADAVQSDMQTRQLQILKPSKIFGKYTRSTPSLQNVGAARGIADDIFALAAQPGPHRVGAIGIPAARKWIVVEMEEVQPLYAGDFEQRVQSVRGFQEQFQVQMGFFDPQNVKLRTGFEPAQQPEDDETDL